LHAISQLFDLLPHSLTPNFPQASLTAGALQAGVATGLMTAFAQR